MDQVLIGFVDPDPGRKIGPRFGKKFDVLKSCISSLERSKPLLNYLIFYQIKVFTIFFWTNIYLL
jgi:hypothetical protein